MLSFIGFFVGKLISVTLLYIVATAISRQFISPDGYIGGFNPRLAAQLAMSGIGAVLAAHWPLETPLLSRLSGLREAVGKGWRPAHAMRWANRWLYALCAAAADERLLFRSAGPPGRSYRRGV